MTEHLVTFLKTRLDEEADLARRCDGDGCCGEWSAHGNTVDFCQVELSDFHPAIALHDPARVPLEVEAKRRILARHVLSPAGAPRSYREFEEALPYAALPLSAPGRPVRAG
ncbi:DUF6221 family protein [Streptomyces sp. NPDC088846]|uniref:DUF6221 family protein n=1 Tax=unclassified Streptomyces TaxID=2593676 RepID=UPI0033DF6900